LRQIFDSNGAAVRCEVWLVDELTGRGLAAAAGALAAVAAFEDEPG
jgi:hypothetical protein